MLHGSCALIKSKIVCLYKSQRWYLGNMTGFEWFLVRREKVRGLLWQSDGMFSGLVREECFIVNVHYYVQQKPFCRIHSQIGIQKMPRTLGAGHQFHTIKYYQTEE